MELSWEGPRILSEHLAGGWWVSRACRQHRCPNPVTTALICASEWAVHPESHAVQNGSAYQHGLRGNNYRNSELTQGTFIGMEPIFYVLESKFLSYFKLLVVCLSSFLLYHMNYWSDPEREKKDEWEISESDHEIVIMRKHYREDGLSLNQFCILSHQPEIGGTLFLGPYYPHARYFPYVV